MKTTPCLFAAALVLSSVVACSGSEWALNRDGFSARLVQASTERPNIQATLVLLQSPASVVAKVEVEHFTMAPLVFKDSILLVAADGNSELFDLTGKRIGKFSLEFKGAIANVVKLDDDGKFCYTDGTLENGQIASTVYISKVNEAKLAKVDQKRLPFFGFPMKWGKGLVLISDDGLARIKLD
jgi:hypothetical protein